MKLLIRQYAVRFLDCMRKKNSKKVFRSGSINNMIFNLFSETKKYC